MNKQESKLDTKSMVEAFDSLVEAGMNEVDALKFLYKTVLQSTLQLNSWRI